MLAVIAGLIFGLAALLLVAVGDIDVFLFLFLGLAFWAFHSAYPFKAPRQ